MKTTSAPAAAPAAADILQTMRDDIAWLDSAIDGAMRTLSSHGWVITVHGLPVGLDTDEAHRITGVHVYGWRGRYSRLTRDDAQRIAPTITNGAGDRGEAFPYVVALENTRRQSVATLAWVEAELAKRAA